MRHPGNDDNRSRIDTNVDTNIDTNIDTDVGRSGDPFEHLLEGNRGAGRCSGGSGQGHRCEGRRCESGCDHNDNDAGCGTGTPGFAKTPKGPAGFTG